MTATETPLTTLLVRLAEWMPIAEFDALMQGYFQGDRSHEEIADYRAKRGVVKPLRDEVAPVLRHLKFVKAQGEVRFALNNSAPDCWLRDNPDDEPRGLEVTIALSREQHHLGRELNERGEGRGFLGLQDTASNKAFADRLAKPRIMYSSASPLRAVAAGIRLCLQKKAKPKYAGFDLLIEAPLDSLPHERWSQIEDELRVSAQAMPFREIHVIANHKPFGFRIK